jgi:putative ATPase
LARFISQKTAADFVALNAVTARVADVKTAIDRARLNLQVKRRTIVFIDEIHRFSKAQQDALLPETESGLITLIGATTENPFFYVIPGLISRAQVLELQALAADDLAKLIERAVQQIKTKQDFEITPEGRQYLVEQAKGDARKLLTLVEMAMAQKVTVVERDLLVKITQNQGTIYNQDMHYDLISAYIKSMRASDATGAIYWLARMLKGGEDPGFVARRMVIFASEDVGNADPQALLLANAALDATKVIGMPEVQINLAQVTHYLAAAPKSRAAYEAIAQANQQIEQGDIQPVPPHLRPHP